MHPKRDICRLFTKAGMLRRLVKQLHKTLNDIVDSDAIPYGEKMADIFYTFAQQNDGVVKSALRKKNVLQGMF